MKKVLILTRSFGTGGTTAALDQLIHRIVKLDIDITIMCEELYGDIKDNVPENIKVEQIPFNKEKYRIYINNRKMPDNSMKMIFYKVEKYIRKKLYKVDSERNRLYDYLLTKTVTENTEYDVVFDYMGYGDFTTAYAAKIIKCKKRAMWLHDEKMLWLKNSQAYLRYYDKFYCVSDTVRTEFVKLHPEYSDKTEVLYNYIDTNQIISKAQGSVTDDRYNAAYKILTVGRLAIQKGYDYAVEAAKLLKDRGVDFVWYAIGDGEERDNLENLIDKYNLGDRFVLLGRINNPYPYINQCDLYVQPSRHEGYGIAVLEARVLNKPVIISQTPCLMEQIKDGYNGFVAPLNSKELADKIEYAYNNKDVCDNIINNLKKDNISFENEIEKLNQFINES